MSLIQLIKATQPSYLCCCRMVICEKKNKINQSEWNGDKLNFQVLCAGCWRKSTTLLCPSVKINANGDRACFWGQISCIIWAQGTAGTCQQQDMSLRRVSWVVRHQGHLIIQKKTVLKLPLGDKNKNKTHHKKAPQRTNNMKKGTEKVKENQKLWSVWEKAQRRQLREKVWTHKKRNTVWFLLVFASDIPHDHPSKEDFTWDAWPDSTMAFLPRQSNFTVQQMSYSLLKKAYIWKWSNELGKAQQTSAPLTTFSLHTQICLNTASVWQHL